VRVLAFTGRESDAPLGIWGAIAEQLVACRRVTITDRSASIRVWPRPLPCLSPTPNAPS
jgi:hypothetical protein